MKTVIYTTNAAKMLKRYGNMAERVRNTMLDRAADPLAHANNLLPMTGRPESRLRIGDYRVLFLESETEITIVDFGPRGGIYGP